MATARVPMLTDDHAAKALYFLAQSDREFAEGDHLQASENLWRAAAHAVMAASEKRGWPHDGSHRALKEAAERLSDDHNDPLIALGFGVAEKFRSNFHYDYMEDFELDADRPEVHDFVHQVLALL